MATRRWRNLAAGAFAASVLFALPARATSDDPDPATAMARMMLGGGILGIACEDNLSGVPVGTAAGAKAAKPDGDGLIDVAAKGSGGPTNPMALEHASAIRAVGPTECRFNASFPAGKPVTGFVTEYLSFFATPEAAPVRVGAGVSPGIPSSTIVNFVNVTVFGSGPDETTSVPVTPGPGGSSIDVVLSFNGTDVSVTTIDLGAVSPTPQPLKTFPGVATPSTPHGLTLAFRPQAKKAHVYSTGASSDRVTAIDAALAPFREAVEAEVEAILLLAPETRDVDAAKAKVQVGRAKLATAIGELDGLDDATLAAANVTRAQADKAKALLEGALQRDDGADAFLGVPNSDAARKQLVAALKRKCKAAEALHRGRVAKLCNAELKKLK